MKACLGQGGGCMRLLLKLCKQGLQGLLQLLLEHCVQVCRVARSDVILQLLQQPAFQGCVSKGGLAGKQTSIRIATAVR